MISKYCRLIAALLGVLFIHGGAATASFKGLSFDPDDFACAEVS
jgi:hypothetical protein